MQNLFSSIFAGFLLLACTGTAPKLAADDTSGERDSLFASLLRYARLAHAAYQDRDQMHQVSKEQKLQFASAGALEIEKIGYFIVTDRNSESITIAVRGTTNLENALVDINYTLKHDSHTGIQLHAGFMQAAANLYREIKPKIEDDYTVHATGHSLGGAVALILAMHLDVDGYKVGDIVTFGQPKVTNRSGAGRFENLNIIRVFTELDIVPVMPPFDLSDIMNAKMDVFWHLGKAYVLLPDKYYATLEGLDILTYGAGFLNKKPDQENIDAHRMDNYLSLIESKVIHSVSIPYKERENFVTAPY